MSAHTPDLETSEVGEAVTVYITFGMMYARETHPSGLPVHPEGWWEVRGLPYVQARALAWCLTGGQFACDYLDRPKDEHYQRGCIYVIEARVPEEENRG